MADGALHGSASSADALASGSSLSEAAMAGWHAAHPN